MSVVQYLNNCQTRLKSHRYFAEPSRLLMQLEKAKSQHARWQSLGKTNPDKKRLESEIEDECKSIAWQARPSPNVLLLVSTAPLL